MEIVFLGRDNPIVRELLQDGQPPEPGAITRVQARIGDVCLSSDEDEEITLAQNVVTLRLGNVGLAPGTYQCKLIVYDAQHPNGLAWDAFYVVAKVWEACGDGTP